MQKFVFTLLISALATLLVFGSSSSTADSRAIESKSELLEIGREVRPEKASRPPATIKILSYNIRWRSGEDLRKLVRLMKDDPEIGGASVLGLQEVDRNKRRSRGENAARFLAEELKMNYAWAAPPSVSSDKEEETGVVILSAYPLADVRRIVLPHKGPGGRRRVALGATIMMGDTKLRFYSVHSETRITIGKKLEQMKAVIEDLKSYPKTLPAVVLGDLNTWEPPAIAKTVKLFKAEGFHTPFDESATFSRQFLFISLDLKLDWIWLRNLEQAAHGIDRQIDLSDHWPL